ncbi:MAG: hypothetical protein V1682_02380, partial [Candidatus Omnitrophota bacterium]
MITKFKTTGYFRATASIVAFSFLMQQIAWGTDGQISSIENSIEKLNIEQSQTFAPAYVQDQQVIHESMVAQKQFIEDSVNAQSLAGGSPAVEATESDEDASIELQGPKAGGSSGEGQAAIMSMAVGEPSTPEEGAILSVTTESGDVIHYRGGQIESIETKDSSGGKIIIIGIEGMELVDVDNNLLNAEITYTDGTIQLIMNGKVSQMTKPDGAVIEYKDDGLIESIAYPDGKITAYSYIKDGQDNIIETILIDSDRESHYDVNSRLKKVIKSDGTIMQYQDGMIASIQKSDGSSYVFVKKEVITEDLENEFVVTLSQYKDKYGNLYDYEDGVFPGVSEDSDIQMEDGTLQIIRSGQLIRVRKTDGPVFSYNRDSSGNISGIILTLPDSVSLYYTPQGDLFKKVDPGGTAYYEYENGIIKDKVIVSTRDVGYTREYGPEGYPIKLVVQNPGNLDSTYLFDESGALAAMAIDANLPTATPFNIPKTDRLE